MWVTLVVFVRTRGFKMLLSFGFFKVIPFAYLRFGVVLAASAAPRRACTSSRLDHQIPLFRNPGRVHLQPTLSLEALA